MKIKGGIRGMRLEDLFKEVRVMESKLNIEQEGEYVAYKTKLFDLVPNIDTIQSKEELDSVYMEMYMDLRLYLNNILKQE